MKDQHKKLTETFVKNAILKFLSANGWGHFQFGELHAHGVDIKAKKHKYGRYILIETKGEGEIRQSNEVAFVYSLGQIITRMSTTGKTRYYYGLGLPEKAAKIALRRLPWQIAKKLLLYVFSVDENGNVIQYSWKELYENQK